MYAEFNRTLRSLTADRSRSFLPAIALIVALAAAWAGWMVLARISVYAVSNSARLETGHASQSIQSLYAGRISANYLVLGRHVHRGDTLVELESKTQQIALNEQQTEKASDLAELETLQRQIAAEEAALKSEDAAAESSVQEAQAKLQEAEAAASWANLDAEKKLKMSQEGLTPQLDAVRAATEARRNQATVEGLRLDIERQRNETQSKQSAHRSLIESLEREAARLAGLQTKAGSTLRRLESEVDLRRVVAETDGTIGDVAPVRAGSVISAGERLGSIVPAGRLRVVAQYNPAAAVGRVRPGQPATLRLDGFPWTQYGTIRATVSTVSNEARDGSVRVDLDLAPESNIPLQYGLPGTAEVEVEHISPVALVLRTTGEYLASKKTQNIAQSR